MEALAFCLDTDVIIEFLKDKDSPASRFINEAKNKAQLFVTAITVYELLYGPKYAEYERELDDVNSFLTWVGILAFDKESAEIAADIDVCLHKKGKPVGLRDVFIASICVKNNLPFITRNLTHFNIIAEETEYKLKILSPEEALQALIKGFPR